MKNIGFIGLGIMGKPMVRNLLKAGFAVTAFDVVADAVQAMADEGAVAAQSPKAAAVGADMVITMVPNGAIVRSILSSADGVLAGAAKGTIIADMSSVTPVESKEFAAMAAEHGCSFLDAPVSGGEPGAVDGTLAIMVGGEREAFERCKDLFAAMGKTAHYFGAAGSGQFVKMSNQIAIASNMLGVAEAMAYAKKSGLDAEAVQQTIAGGAAGSWSLTNLAPKMLAGDWSPGFFIKHFLKDMRIAVESAEEMGLDLPGLKLAKKLYEELSARGMEDCGTQAIFCWYEGE